MRKIRIFISQVLISIILILIFMIICKKNISFKGIIYDKIYSNNISFGYLNTLYNKYLGSIIPFNIDLETKPVFNEKLKYKSINKYLEGCVLEVDDNYMVPSLKEGLVVFIGEKNGYGNTIIIECEDGIEIWYSNIDNVNVSLYDYITSSTFLGTSIDNKIYLVFKNNGEVLNYEDYI